MELGVVGEGRLGVLKSTDVIVLFLNLEGADLSGVARLLVQLAFHHAQQDRKHLVVRITDIDQALRHQKGVFPAHRVFLPQPVLVLLNQVLKSRTEEQPVY